MNYSKTILILTIFVSATMIGVPRSAYGDASSPASTLSIGDWWKYNVQTPIAGLILTGTETKTLVYQANNTGTQWTVRTISSGTLAGTGVTGTWVEGGWDHLRKTDLAEVDSRFNLNITLVGAATATIYFNFVTTNTSPILDYEFPLTVGSSWSMSGQNQTVYATYYYSFNPTVNVRTNTTSTNAVFNVLTSPLTTVTAGTYDSYQIRKRDPDGSYTDSYYSPETENIVKQLGYAANGTQESSTTLTDYSAWPYKSTIGLTVRGSNYNAVVGTDVSVTNIHQDGRSIIFIVTGTDAVTGKASVWIPVRANNTVIKVLVDTTAVSYTASSNQTYHQIIFSFPLSTHTITVTYTAPSFLEQYLIPIVVGIATAAAVIIITTIILVLRGGRKPEPTPFWQPPSTPPPTPPPPAETPPQSPPPTN